MLHACKFTTLAACPLLLLPLRDGYPSAIDRSSPEGAAVVANRSARVNAIGGRDTTQIQENLIVALCRNRIQKASPERPHREPDSFKLPILTSSSMKPCSERCRRARRSRGR
jgi:hypothetical protein